MKNSIIFSILTLITALTCSAQLISEVPVDDAGKVVYSEVVNVDSVDRTTLYLASKKFYQDNFGVHDKNFLSLDDREQGIIVIKPYTHIQIRTLGIPNTEQMFYTLKIQCRDGRYRYEISEISYKTMPSSKIGTAIVTKAEDMFAKDKFYKDNGKPRDNNEQHLTQTKSMIDQISAALKAEMGKSRQLTAKNSEW